MTILKVIHAKYREKFIIELKFNDGITKCIDFQPLLKGDIFEPLKDVVFFRNFKLNPFTIEWDNGADFAPEFLYEYDDSSAEKTTLVRYKE